MDDGLWFFAAGRPDGVCILGFGSLMFGRSYISPSVSDGNGQQRSEYLYVYVESCIQNTLISFRKSWEDDSLL